jgi:hypothetical protein
MPELGRRQLATAAGDQSTSIQAVQPSPHPPPATLGPHLCCAAHPRPYTEHCRTLESLSAQPVSSRGSTEGAYLAPPASVCSSTSSITQMATRRSSAVGGRQGWGVGGWGWGESSQRCRSKSTRQTAAGWLDGDTRQRSRRPRQPQGPAGELPPCTPGKRPFSSRRLTQGMSASTSGSAESCGRYKQRPRVQSLIETCHVYRDTGLPTLPFMRHARAASPCPLLVFDHWHTHPKQAQRGGDAGAQRLQQLRFCGQAGAGVKGGVRKAAKAGVTAGAGQGCCANDTPQSGRSARSSPGGGRRACVWGCAATGRHAVHAVLSWRSPCPALTRFVLLLYLLLLLRIKVLQQGQQWEEGGMSKVQSVKTCRMPDSNLAVDTGDCTAACTAPRTSDVMRSMRSARRSS